ncbi:MAG: hypothetical protein ABIP94_14630 [Planctomycetota bacterium]
MCGVRHLATELLPDAHDVARQLKRREAHVVGLVLEQQVDEGLATADRRGEQKVGLLIAQVFIDEGGVDAAQRAPIDGGDHVGRQDAAQKLRGALGIAEGSAEERIVRAPDVTWFVHSFLACYVPRDGSAVAAHHEESSPTE